MEHAIKDKGESKQDNLATVLVSGEGLVATFQGMYEKCHFMDMLDFCTLAEAIVLNDKIEIVSDIEYAYSLAQSSVLVRLQDAGAVSTITTHRGNDEFSSKAPLKNANLRLDTIGSNRFTLKGEETTKKEPLGTFTLDQVFDEATSLLRAERELGISALPMRRFSSLYIPNAKVREEHTVCDLMGRFNEISEGLKNSREKSRFNLTPLVTAHIPPIPVTVMERAASGRDLLELILELRDEYSKLRDSLVSLRKQLNDPEIPPNEKQKIISGWHQSWETLNKYKIDAEIDIGSTTNEVIDVDKSVDLQTIDLKLSSLTDLMIKHGRNAYHKWRVRMIHKTAEKYLSTSDGKITRDLERIYNREFTKKDLRDLQDWEKMISLMTIDLEGMSPKQDYSIERSPVIE